MFPFALSPNDSYQQTLRTRGVGEVRIVRARGGQHQYGHIQLSVQPLARGGGFEFSDEAAVEGAIPRKFLSAVETGVLRAARVGLWGFPLTDFRVTVFDGSYHDVDSTVEVFEEVAEMAFLEAMIRSKPLLLEPWITLTVSLSEEYIAAVFGDLNQHRSSIIDTQQASLSRITVKIPQHEAIHFLQAFTLRTSGSGTFSATAPESFEELPESLTWRYFCSICGRNMVIPLVQGEPVVGRCLICSTPFEPPDFAVPVRNA